MPALIILGYVCDTGGRETYTHGGAQYIAIFTGRNQELEHSAPASEWNRGGGRGWEEQGKRRRKGGCSRVGLDAEQAGWGEWRVRKRINSDQQRRDRTKYQLSTADDRDGVGGVKAVVITDGARERK